MAFMVATAVYNIEPQVQIHWPKDFPNSILLTIKFIHEVLVLVMTS